MSTEIEASPTHSGNGIDTSPLQRPGIPQERQPPQPLANAHWLEPDRQLVTERPLVGQGLELTPVFSTAIPVRGVSGMLRRVAYGIPDYKARRWLLLMAADRVDVLEHRPTVLIKWGAMAAVLGVGIALSRRFRRG